MSTFDIVTVNWNQGQTNLWRRHVERHCPEANIILVPDKKPYPHCWSSGKLCCFEPLRDTQHPGRFVYMDTDCIVTRDIEPLFGIMEDAELAVSSAIPASTPMAKVLRSHYIANKLKFGLTYNKPPTQYSSGFMVLKNYSPVAFGEMWKHMFEHSFIKNVFGRHKLFDEITMAFAIAQLRTHIWDMPFEIHGNIMGRTCYFGKSREPMVIHYHNKRRLLAQGLERYIDEAD
jgi:hypothetical protein